YPPPTRTHPLSLHDALPILIGRISAFMKTSRRLVVILRVAGFFELQRQFLAAGFYNAPARENVDNIRHDVIKQALIMGNDHVLRSEEHTSELQSRSDLVCRL